MQIAENMAVSIHYTLTNISGETLDSSVGNEPLVYLHGSGNIIPGLENALKGKAAGDKFDVTVAPEDAYGEKHDGMVQVVPKSVFEGMPVEVGMQFQADVKSGPGIITVVQIDGDQVTIDGNHPLAGEELNFAVEVMEVRMATEDEIAHGHVHGAGGHHH